MPKLDKKTAKTVDDTEPGGEFPLMDEGTVLGRLVKVTVSDQEGPSGFKYWTWEFDCFDVNEGLPDEDSARIGKVWPTTSLSPAAAFKMSEMFHAFDVPADTDTDLLCGQVIKLLISHSVAEKGKRKGQTQAQADNYLPLGDEFDEEVDLPAGDDETL